MPISTSPHSKTAPARPLGDRATLACTLDRAADAALFFGRATMAERLSARAAELRECAP